MPASIRIQHLQWVGGAVAALGCVMLGGGLIISNLADFRRYDRAVAELARFQSVLAAADAMATERAPANSAMGPPAGRERALVAALVAKRVETDRLLDQMRMAFQGELATLPQVREELIALERHLASARMLVDAVTATPLDKRDGAAVVLAIEAMFIVADDAAALRDRLGQAVIRVAPQVGTEILLQTSASAMREAAGRLGSYAVMRLTGGTTRDGIAVRFYQAEARVQQTWDLLSGYGQAYSSTASIDEAIEAVRQHYFSDGWVLAHEVVAQPGPPRFSAAEFSQRHAPSLQALNRLRDNLGEVLRRKMDGLRGAALTNIAVSGGLAAIVVAVLATLTLLFRSRLFRPLFAARQEILAITRGDLSEPKRLGPASREIGEMFDGLTRLRDEQRQKRQLEQEQLRLTLQLRTLSETDPVTGLLNRRALTERAATILAEADRRRIPVGVLLFDLDHFKAVNDTYGHAVGDLVLGRIGGQLRPLLAPSDLFARYGGEEFLVLLPDLRGRSAEDVAERLCRTLGGAAIEANAPSITASFGVAVRPPGSSIRWEALTASADRRLYRAKLAGRNRVCADDPDEGDSDGAPGSLLGDGRPRAA